MYVENDSVNWIDPEGLKSFRPPVTNTRGSSFGARRPPNWRPNWRGKTPQWRPYNRKPQEIETTPNDPLQNLPDPGDPNSEPFIIPSPGYFECIQYVCKNSCTDEWETGPFLYPKGKNVQTDPNCVCKRYEYYPPGQY